MSILTKDNLTSKYFIKISHFQWISIAQLTTSVVMNAERLTASCNILYHYLYFKYLSQLMAQKHQGIAKNSLQFSITQFIKSYDSAIYLCSEVPMALGIEKKFIATFSTNLSCSIFSVKKLVYYSILSIIRCLLCFSLTTQNIFIQFELVGIFLVTSDLSQQLR